jgi:hypothetical protein
MVIAWLTARPRTRDLCCRAQSRADDRDDECADNGFAGVLSLHGSLIGVTHRLRAGSRPILDFSGGPVAAHTL